MPEPTVEQLRRSLRLSRIMWAVLAVVTVVQAMVMVLEVQTLSTVRREAVTRESLLIEACRQTTQEITSASAQCTDVPVAASQ